MHVLLLNLQSTISEVGSDTPSYDEETKYRKVLIWRIVGLLVNSLVIFGPSLCFLRLPPQNLSCLTPPALWMMFMVLILWQVFLDVTAAVVTGGCATCHHASCTVTIPVDELPLTGPVDIWSLYLGLRYLPSGFDPSNRHQCNHLNLVWQLLPFFSCQYGKQYKVWEDYVTVCQRVYLDATCH